MVVKNEESLEPRKKNVRTKKYPRRQGFRKSITLIMFILFPAIFFYFSPYLSIMGPLEGYISGSLIVFGTLFISAIFLGRTFCGWLCPMGGGQDIVMFIRKKDKRINIKTSWIKWMIFIPWLAIIIILPLAIGGEFNGFDFLYQTRDSYGMSLTSPQGYVIYYGILLIVFLMVYLIGRRSFCHHLCWIAPFMILGRWIGNLVRIPTLRLKANKEVCNSCKRCDRECPMSLPVEEHVMRDNMEHRECILCATCIDVCPRSVISYSFSSFKK
ncbi:MAG: 4Fe-4S binding protein [Candidatus Heimdallarchaeaceae archaeon]|jgi:polyferredoxin